MNARSLIVCGVLGLVAGAVSPADAQLSIFRSRRSPRQETNPVHERAKSEAEQAYQQGDYQRSIDLTSSVIRQNSRDHVAHYLRAAARVELGLSRGDATMVRSGIADSREAIRLDPESSTMYYLPYLYGMTNLAGLENRAEHAEITVQVAGQILDQSAEQSEIKANILYQRAMAHVHLKSFEKAAADYEAALEIDRTHLGAYLGLADSHAQAGETDEALSAFARAVATFPANPLVYNNRGMYLLQLDRPDEAIADFDRALEIDETYFYALTNRGYASLQSNDPQAAETDFTRSLRLNHNQPAVYSMRSSARLMQGNLTGALADQSAAARLLPRDAGTQAELGFVRFFTGDYAAAKSAFDRAIELDPKMKHLHPWRLAAAQLHGESTESRQEFLPLHKEDAGSRDWVDHLLAYLLDESTEKQLLSAAGGDPAVGTAQRCEAHYFIALKKQQAGESEVAQEHFQKALETKAAYLAAYRGAMVALKQFASHSDETAAEKMDDR